MIGKKQDTMGCFHRFKIVNTWNNLLANSPQMQAGTEHNASPIL